MKVITRTLAFAAVATLTASAFGQKTYNPSIHAFLNGDQSAPRGGATYGTGFESGEGFAPAPIGGQAGWTMFAASTAEGHVDTVNPFAGSQHLRISGDPTIGGGTLTGGFSPDLGAQTPNQAYMSVQVNIGAAGGADYDIVPQAPSQGFLSARLKFNFGGNVFVLDDTGGGLAFEDTGYDWSANAGTYQHVEIMLDNDNNTIDYYIDGNLIYSSVAGVFAGTAFEQVVLISDNFQAGESGDFDDLYFENVIPTPGALALLGVAGFMGRRRRRM